MAVTPEQVETLVAYCEAELGDRTLWKTPEGYPDSLALCVIDAIYSTGSHYTSVVNVVNRYRERHGRTDGVTSLLASIEKAGGADRWASDVAVNVKPAHTRPGAPLKAEVISQAATALQQLGIDTVPDFVAAVQDNPQDNAVRTAWRALPSQSSGVTYNYLLILAGLPSVKPDRMVLRFLGTALGSNAVEKDHAVDLIAAAADSLGVSARTLDHIVWRAASGRHLTD